MRIALLAATIAVLLARPSASEGQVPYQTITAAEHDGLCLGMAYRHVRETLRAPGYRPNDFVMWYPERTDDPDDSDDLATLDPTFAEQGLDRDKRVWPDLGGTDALMIARFERAVLVMVRHSEFGDVTDLCTVVETLPVGNAGPVTRGSISAWDDNVDGVVSCSEARAHGIAPMTRDHPAYRPALDRDGDGIACDQ